ncbi:MAG: acetyltransferase [Bacteroidetes bacterium GWF2_33_38]|nr:MAG: acetyltransferase [Bacteroidetes bacterium GWF2_33_38]HBX50603.1 acetyltransferase [Bacteroidales bacterium]
MDKPKIIIFGGGGHCKSCIDVIETENRFIIAGIVDIKEKIGEEILGYKIIGCDFDIPELIKKYKNALITIGQISSPENRIRIFNILENNQANLPTIISPFAYVSKHTKIGKGTIVLHHALIYANAQIGINCIINSKALIEQDVEIGDHCHISTSSVVNGGVKIGDKVFFGSNAVSRQGVEISDYSFIKANSIVK